MAARESIDRLSDTLLCDERILNVSERELLAKLLQRARSQVSVSGNAVAETITRVVGEVIAERAYGVLGEGIARRLLQQQSGLSSSRPQQDPGVIHAGGPPPTPAPGPGDPNRSGPQPPGPSPPGGVWARTQPTGASLAARTATEPARRATGGVALLETPEFMPAECVVLDEFLASAELNALMQDTLQREMEFQVSEVVSPGVAGGAVNYEHRRSRVLVDLGKHQSVIVDRLQACLPRVLRKLGHQTFPISRVEAQITASNHGDFFHWHCDNGAEEIASREITFVYFFHREPKKFRGGELRIYDSRWENNQYVPTANYRVIVPEQNQMVLFVSSLAHEITPVECPSEAFPDSRFTVNGWLHR